MFPRFLVRVTEWVKAHKQLGLQSEKHRSHTWVFLRKWRKKDFFHVAVGVIGRHFGTAIFELVMLGQVLCAIGSGASLVSISGGLNTLVGCYKEYLGSGYMQWLLDNSTFDVQLLKRCLQKTASTKFATLDALMITECIVTRLKGADHRDRMNSRQSLRRATETGDLSPLGW